MLNTKSSFEMKRESNRMNLSGVSTTCLSPLSFFQIKNCALGSTPSCIRKILGLADNDYGSMGDFWELQHHGNGSLEVIPFSFLHKELEEAPYL